MRVAPGTVGQCSSVSNFARQVAPVQGVSLLTMPLSLCRYCRYCRYRRQVSSGVVTRRHVSLCGHAIVASSCRYVVIVVSVVTCRYVAMLLCRHVVTVVTRRHVSLCRYVVTVVMSLLSLSSMKRRSSLGSMCINPINNSGK